jgi:hypothetical protein
VQRVQGRKDEVSIVSETADAGAGAGAGADACADGAEESERMNASEDEVMSTRENKVA